MSSKKEQKSKCLWAPPRPAGNALCAMRGGPGADPGATERIAPGGGRGQRKLRPGDQEERGGPGGERDQGERGDQEERGTRGREGISLPDTAVRGPASPQTKGEPQGRTPESGDAAVMMGESRTRTRVHRMMNISCSGPSGRQ